VPQHIDSLINALRRRPQNSKQEETSYNRPQRSKSSRNGNTPPRSLHTLTPQHRRYDPETSAVISQPTVQPPITDYLEQLDDQSHIDEHTNEDNSDTTSIEPMTFRHAPDLKNPIPAPSIHIKSEYPNLTRSEEARVLICMVTVEVPSGRWKPNGDELGLLRNIPDTRSMQSNRSELPDDSSDECSVDNTEDLQREANDLSDKVDNWHGLPFTK